VIVHAPSMPSLRVRRDPYKVEGLHPRFLAVVSAYLGQLFNQLDLGFFYPEVVRRLPRGLCYFLGYSSGGFDLLQLSFKV